MLNKALLIVNPISGTGNKVSLVKQVKSYAQDKDIALELYQTIGKNDDDNIRDYLESGNFQRILVCGGDGTVKVVAQVVTEFKDIDVGILPAGSANGLAESLNLPGNRDDQLEIAFGNEVMDVDAVDINGHISLHLSDIGLNAEMIHKFEKSDLRGYLGYTVESINTLSTSESPFNVQLEIDNSVFDYDVRMVVLANAQKYGTGAVVNPIGKINDGKFEVVVIKNLELKEIFKFMTGNHEFEKENVEIYSVSEAVINCEEGVHFQLDGEYVDRISEIEAQIMPAYVSITVGHKENAE